MLYLCPYPFPVRAPLSTYSLVLLPDQALPRWNRISLPAHRVRQHQIYPPSMHDPNSDSPLGRHRVEPPQHLRHHPRTRMTLADRVHGGHVIGLDHQQPPRQPGPPLLQYARRAGELSPIHRQRALVLRELMLELLALAR